MLFAGFLRNDWVALFLISVNMNIFGKPNIVNISIFMNYLSKF